MIFNDYEWFSIIVIVFLYFPSICIVLKRCSMLPGGVCGWWVLMPGWLGERCIVFRFDVYWIWLISFWFDRFDLDSIDVVSGFDCFCLVLIYFVWIWLFLFGFYWFCLFLIDLICMSFIFVDVTRCSLIFIYCCWFGIILFKFDWFRLNLNDVVKIWLMLFEFDCLFLCW